jgi:hypothetical protein
VAQTAQARDLANGNAALQWAVGSDILIAAGIDRALFWARLPMILIGVMGGLLVYLWGRLIAGAAAGLGALFLFTLDPIILGHAYLVTLDVGLAAFMLLFLFCLWLYARSASRRRLVFTGLALGAVLCAKFSALCLLPVAMVLLVLARAQRPRFEAAAGDLCPCGSGRKFKNCHGAARQPRFDFGGLVHTLRALAVIGAIAAVVVWAIYGFHNPAAYLTGMNSVYADRSPDHLAYLGGRMDTSFTSYFAVAYLLKEPLAYIALALLGLFALWRSRDIQLADKLFLVVPPAVLFLVHMWKADDIGVRYIIPCLPFAHLLGGIALAWLWRSGSRLRRYAAVLLCTWAVAAAISIYPDQLSYFNESACLLDDPGLLGWDGGSRCGVAWLDDSNVDWGLDVKALKSWLDRHARGRTVRLARFGYFPPEAYGLAYEKLEPLQLVSPPSPGLYAVSAHLVASETGLVHHYREGIDWLRTTPPVAIIGHSIYVYDIK